MREVSITVDVMCKWAVEPPAYRLYVNDELLTERTYIWDNSEQYVKEHIVVNLESGVHTLRLEPVASRAVIFLKRNLTVDNRPQALVNDQFTVH
jgi:hypothetical protein